MSRGNNALVLTLLLLFCSLSGCLRALDDVINEIEGTESDYPSLELGERTRSSPALVQYDECTNLLEDLRNAAFEESLVSLDQNAYWHWTDSYYYRAEPFPMDGAIAEDAAFDDGETGISSPSVGSTDSNSGEPVAGTDFSGTNTQEQGVDEADFMKTDGRWIYVLNNFVIDFSC